MAASGDGSQIDLDPERVAQLIAQHAGVQLIDVREPYEHAAGRIAGARHIELVSLAAEAATIDAERPIVFYCRVGSRSKMAAQALRAAGIEAHSMAGGLVRWVQEGRPLEPDGGHVADH
jgi:rhodanese-related sulfurtransferase